MKISTKRLFGIIGDELTRGIIEETVKRTITREERKIQKNNESRCSHSNKKKYKMREYIESIIKEKLNVFLQEADSQKTNNPWAICTAQVGRDDKAKYERCVKKVKRKS